MITRRDAGLTRRSADARPERRAPLTPSVKKPTKSRAAPTLTCAAPRTVRRRRTTDKRVFVSKADPQNAERRVASLEAIGGEPARLLRKPLGLVGELRDLPLMERSALGRTFRDEELHMAPVQPWLDRDWEVRLASVGGVIYKVGLESNARDREDAIDLSTKVYTTLQQALGAPSQQADAIFVWDGEDGNAILQLANVAGDRGVMVIFTSSIVRTFARG